MALRWTAIEAEPTVVQAPVLARPPAGPAPTDGRRTDGRADVSVAEAVHLLGRRGYVRTVEPAGTVLWCASCACKFEPAVLLVGAVLAADGGTVMGLRDPATGAGVVWVVREWTEEERSLVRRIRWRPLARRHRPTAARARHSAQAIT